MFYSNHVLIFTVDLMTMVFFIGPDSQRPVKGYKKLVALSLHRRERERRGLTRGCHP